MGTFTTSGAVAFKAGLNHSTVPVEVDYIRAIDYAENWICTECRADYSAAYATIPLVYRQILGDVASSKAAIPIINFDMSGYTGRGEAEDMINVNYTIVQDGIKILTDDKVKTKLGVA